MFMKMTFIFSDSANLSVLSPDDLCRSHCEFPDTALQLPDIEERILTLANLVGGLTNAVVHVACKELGFNNYPIKVEKVGTEWIHIGATHPTVLCFRRAVYQRIGPNRMTLKVIAPSLPFHTPPHLRHGRNGYIYLPLSRAQIRYPGLEPIYELADLCLSLLNEQQDSESQWP